jgi:hypothetical protein
MNKVGVRKAFDRKLYNVADRDAKAAALRFIKDMNYTTIDTSERKDYDIVCKAVDSAVHHLYEVEIKYAWKGDWPPYWKEIRIPYRKVRLLKKWKEDYPDSLFTFLVFRDDCKKAWHIDANVIADCEVKEVSNRNIEKGEKFFHILTEDASLIDIP